MKNVDISIILPVYNQEAQLEFIVDSYTRLLNKRDYSYELIFVVNNTIDNSYERLKDIKNKYPHVRVYEIDKGGWGRAVLYGVKKSSGDIICYTNSSRTNPIDLYKMIDIFLRHPGVVLKATRIIRDSFLRKFGSTFYNVQARLLFRLAVWDINGTPKILNKSTFEKLKITSQGDLIDAELLIKSSKKGIHILEFPVIHTQRISGKSTTSLKSALRMYCGLYKLKKDLNDQKK